jgi:ketosteroid isomerase-like protein
MTEVREMGAQEDAAVVRLGYGAFSAGDMDTLRELFAEDAVWHTGGSGGLSGDKQGRDAIVADFGELTLSGGKVAEASELQEDTAELADFRS